METAVWSPSRPKIVAQVDFARLDSFEVRVYQDLGGAELVAAIELVSPAKQGSRREPPDFRRQCAGYLKNGISVVIIDVVTARSANLHRELFEMLEAKWRQRTWVSSTGLYAVAYRAVTLRKRPRIEAWPEKLTLGKPLPSCRSG